MEEKAEQARRLFLSGANCAQAVLGAFHEECRLDRETALRLASGFGGGISRLREMCGALSGMILAENLIHGYSDLTDKAVKDAHYKRIRALVEEFRRETGAILCRELLGLAPGQSDEPVSAPLRRNSRTRSRNPRPVRKKQQLTPPRRRWKELTNAHSSGPFSGLHRIRHPVE